MPTAATFLHSTTCCLVSGLRQVTKPAMPPVYLFLSSFLANFETSTYSVTFELLGFCSSVDELSVLLPYDTISLGI